MRILSNVETFATLVVPPVLIVVMNGFIIHTLGQFNKTFRSLNRSPSLNGPQQVGAAQVSYWSLSLKLIHLYLIYSELICADENGSSDFRRR